jgi:beta-lactamase superfamily II metal-dependent hydrolase
VPIKRTGASRLAARRQGPTAPEVRIRMYRQGLGDCMLLTFRAPNTKECHVVIDCGVLQGSPDGAERVSATVADIAKEAKQLDLLITTHEHADHLSGFNSARDTWEKLVIRRTWMAWTENEENPEVKEMKRRQWARLQAALAGVARLEQAAAAMVGERQSRVQHQCQAARGVLAFAFDEGDDWDALTGASAEKRESGPAKALRWLKERAGSTLDYCHPRDEPRRLGDINGVRVFVLGPPEGELIRRSNPRKGEAYELFGGLLDSDVCFGLAAAKASAAFGIPDPATAQPFDAFHQRRYERVKTQSLEEYQFFKEHYGFEDDSQDAWRRIECDWLNVSEALALALTGHVNNTSLVVAFELGAGGPVLLFPGDAQAGSWRSWAGLKWRFREGGQTRTVTGADLLKRTVFYKVGHHGSHNATMKENGLELMVDPRLVAFVPVHRATANRHSWKMPWKPLWTRLKERASDRVILSDFEEPMKQQLTPPPGQSEISARRWRDFQKAVRWDKSDEALWVEYTCRW